MDMNDYSSRQFICENLKNMNRLGRAFFARPFLKEATLPTEISQPPKFSDYQPSKVLTFLSELTNDDQIDQETKINLLFADLFEVEYAFFLHKQSQKNGYLLRAIGGMKLPNKIKFNLPLESESGPNYDISEHVARNSGFRKVILDLIQKPIRNIKVISGCPEENETQCSFMLILLNKYLSLGKNKLKIIAGKGSYQSKKIPAKISMENDTLMRDVMRLLSPILNTLLNKDASALLKWLPETAKTLTVLYNDESAWINNVISLLKNKLDQDRIKIHLAEDAEKFLKENPNAIKETSASNDNKVGKTNFCIPIMAAGEMLGVFEILKKEEDSISSQDIGKAQTIALISTFGILFWQLQQLQQKKNV